MDFFQKDVIRSILLLGTTYLFYKSMAFWEAVFSVTDIS